MGDFFIIVKILALCYRKIINRTPVNTHYVNIIT